ncbi:MAG: lytic transglycosylase domain-containing protein [Spirochaetaceae bacterium]|nr:lytic transglycosylase domain-containing protein [Spirochaetaceae bacterium]
MKKILLAFIFTFFLFCSYSSEKDQSEIWGMDLELFKSSLFIKEYTFISSIDFDKLQRKGHLNEVFKLQSGAAFYFSFILEELNLYDDQMFFLETELHEGKWKKEALLKISEILSEKKQWNLLASYLKKYLLEVESDPEIIFLLMEVLFKNGEYQQIISLSEEDYSSHYSVLSLIKIKHNLWKSALIEHIYNSASLEQVYELFNLLTEENLFFDLDLSTRLYLLALSSYFIGDLFESGEYFNDLIIDASIFDSYPSLFYKLRQPLQNTGQTKKWANFFFDLSQSINGRSSFASSFTAARLFISLKVYDKAEISLRLAIKQSSSEFEEDRARWYLMNMYSSNLNSIAGLIEEFAPLWNDPYYFDDVLEKFLALVVSRGEWSLFNRIYGQVLLYGDQEILAAFSWIKYLALKSGLISGGDEIQLIRVLLESPHLGFYNLMGMLVSEKEIHLVENQEIDYEYSDIDLFIRGFFEFGLEDQALNFIKGREGQINDDILRIASHYAASSGDFLRSIQLINYVISKKGYTYSPEDLKLMYPNEYPSKINYYSEEYGFPGVLLSGIIRTESAFTHDIISKAGAVGLSQLMPATALDQARKLGIENLDLTNPETNIRIGSSYVKWVIERPWSDNLAEVLIAYNAGGGNLRKWKRIYPDYRDELFIELLPYKETRNYVRKVVTSSIIYGFIYNRINPEETVQYIYPDFNSLKSIQNQ